jgi:hypothetical protein
MIKRAQREQARTRRMHAQPKTHGAGRLHPLQTPKRKQKQASKGHKEKTKRKQTERRSNQPKLILPREKNA